MFLFRLYDAKIQHYFQIIGCTRFFLRSIQSPSAIMMFPFRGGHIHCFGANPTRAANTMYDNALLY